MVTAAQLKGLARYGELKIDNCFYLDSLKQKKPYGGCFLISDEEAEKVKEANKKIEIVCLTRAEMQIVDFLNKREIKK